MQPEKSGSGPVVSVVKGSMEEVEVLEVEVEVLVALPEAVVAPGGWAAQQP
jgi:hypothetical protein